MRQRQNETRARRPRCWWDICAPLLPARLPARQPGALTCELNKSQAPADHPASLLQTILACRQYAQAYSSTLQASAGAATVPVNQLGAAFAAVDLSQVLSMDNAHRVFRWVRGGWEGWEVSLGDLTVLNSI